MSKPHVIVVGAGILGASIALHSVEAGASVTVVDEGKPGRRATAGSFAWINAHSMADEAYFQFRLASIRLWQERRAAMPTLPVRFGGTLNWEDPPDEIEAVQRALNDGGNPARLVTREEIRGLEPRLANPPELAIEASGEGVADPARIAETLLFAALARGATLRTNARMLGLAFEGSRVAGVEVPEDVVEGDAVVLATGTATAEILAQHGYTLPMDNAPGLLIATTPVEPLTQRVLTSQALHVWQKDDGSLLVGEDFGGTDPAEGEEQIAERVMEKLRAFFTDIGNVDVGSTGIARRPKPADGYPALGRVPGLDGLWVATTHSGVTLAPVIGAALAQEITGGKLVKSLHPYRLDRFADSQ